MFIYKIAVNYLQKNQPFITSVESVECRV